jgi:hypothetical protein
MTSDCAGVTALPAMHHHEARRGGDGPLADRATVWSKDAWDDEGAQILLQAASRGGTLLSDLAAERCAAASLDALLRYVQDIVIPRCVDFDAALQRSKHATAVECADVAEVLALHLRVRLAAENLSWAETRVDHGRELERRVGDLVLDLERTIGAEAIACGRGLIRSGVSTKWLRRSLACCAIEDAGALGRRPWGEDDLRYALVARMHRLRPGEVLSLQGGTDLLPVVGEVLRQFDFGQAVQIDDPPDGTWQVELRRRVSD